MIYFNSFMYGSDRFGLFETFNRIYLFMCSCFSDQLLRIEEELGDKAVYAGENWRPKL